MRTVIHIALALLSIFTSAAASAADFTHNIDVRGTSRSFIVHVPDSLAGKTSLPAVLVFHGGGGDADGVRRQTDMDDVADKSGFVAVYPQGTGGMLFSKMKTWNAGACCGAAARKKVDDVAFASKMIDFLVANHAVDPRRVYATGHSNGAMISYRLACELSDKIAAIAPNSGQRVFSDCHPKRPVPVLHLHGTKDPCAPFNGGDKCGGCYEALLGFSLPGDKWPCRPVRDVVSEHAKINGCQNITDIVFTKGAVTCEAFEGCPKDGAVELCSIEGAGHVWAGGHGGEAPQCHDDQSKKICKTYRATVGPANNDINAGQFMWDFFKDIRLPEKSP